MNFSTFRLFNFSTAAAIALAIASSAFAEPTVSNVAVQVRWPFDGLVDIDFTIEGDEDEDFLVGVTATVAGAKETLSAKTFSTEPVMRPGGKKRLVWDFGADYPGMKANGMKAAVSAKPLYAADTPLYLVVDVSAGADAPCWPVRYKVEDPVHTVGAEDPCKTTEIWLKRVRAGTARMGLDKGGARYYPGHTCVLTNDYYLGIFPVTQKQCYCLMGSYMSKFTNEQFRATRPSDSAWNVQNPRFNSATPLKSIAAFNGVCALGRLRIRTGLGFTVPTEWQWEYACRAGAEDDTPDEDSFRHGGNSKPPDDYEWKNERGMWDARYGTSYVDQYPPNAWGFYGMLGNIWELCLNLKMSKAVFTNDVALVDPLGPSGGDEKTRARPARGGSWTDDKTLCTPESIDIRDPWKPDPMNWHYGFRLCLPVWGGSARAVRGKDAKPVSVTVNAAGRTLIDFGLHQFGWIEVDAAADGPYEFVWGEMIDESGSVVTDAMRTEEQGNIRYARAQGRFDKRGWTQIPYEVGRGAFNPAPVGAFGTVMPFRWIEVVKAPFAITADNVRQVPVCYPYNMAEESFDCDSSALVRVHDFCKHSIRATTFAGKFIDGDRERLPYEADSYITQLGTYAVTSDDALVRRTIRHLSTHTTWPTEWKQFFIRMVHEDWMRTGKTDLVREYWELMRDVKSWRHLRRYDGLVVTHGPSAKPAPDGATPRDIVDWAKCYRDGFVFTEVNAVVNALHYRNLKELEEMARAIGKDAEAATFADEAARTFDAYQRVLFDEAAGRYRDGVGTDHATVQGNAMALACGVVPPERAGSVADYVAAKGFSCSTYMAQFVLEALFAAGRDGDAFRLMLSEGDRGWLSMMAKGATITPEFWDLTMEEPGRVPDMNHAWSTAPLNMLSRRVLGVTPLKPGFEEVAVRPRPGPLKRLSGAVPTPKGLVRLSMELKGGVWRVSLSSPAPAKFEFAERHELNDAK